MPIGYFYDDARNQVLLTFEGTVEPDHVSTVVSRLIEDGTWYHARLCDMRSTIEHSSLAALQAFLSYVPGEIPVGGRRAPIAIVVRHPVLHEKACTLASTIGRTLAIEVFDDRDEAAQWLTDIVSCES